MNRKEIIHNKAKELAMELQETIGISEHSFDTLVEFFERMASFADDNLDEMEIAKKFGLSYDLNGHIVDGNTTNIHLKRYWDLKKSKLLKQMFEDITGTFHTYMEEK